MGRGARVAAHRVPEAAAAQPRTILFRFSVRSEKRPGSPSASEEGGAGRSPPITARPDLTLKAARDRVPRGLEASEGAGAALGPAAAPHTHGKPERQGPRTERKT